MKTTSIFAAAILSITGAAFAQGEANYEYPQAATAAANTATSRADVQADLRQARAAGLIVSGEASVPQAPVVALKSRDQVRTLAAVSTRSLPLNVEAISFDGLAPTQRLAGTAPMVAQASK